MYRRVQETAITMIVGYEAGVDADVENANIQMSQYSNMHAEG